MYCLLARPCIIQPGNFTCWGSEGVKTEFVDFTWVHSFRYEKTINVY